VYPDPNSRVQLSLCFAFCLLTGVMSIHVCELWFGWDPLALPMVNGMSDLGAMRFELWAVIGGGCNSTHHLYGLPETRPLALPMVEDMPNLC
jgi:hypothetical protein